MKKSFFILLSLLVFVSCQKTQVEYEESLQYVLDEHDILMEDMTKVSSLLQRVKLKMDTTDEGQDFAKSADKLKAANEAMFDWMHDFNEDFPDIHDKEKEFTDEEYQERIERLKEHEKTLERLKTDFEESISTAENLLNDKSK
ncbi:MAG TPA: hypothetical protein VK021_05660 [Flavobacteriaceae bacterium]|nr:hypothetical protein [Flavobacteriaceae bacterium]